MTDDANSVVMLIAQSHIFSVNSRQNNRLNLQHQRGPRSVVLPQKQLTYRTLANIPFRLGCYDRSGVVPTPP